MILTTTNSIDGLKILEYRGIVSGIAINSEKLKLTFSMEKYYQSRVESLQSAKDQALQQMQEHAKKLYANAIVGIKVDIELTTTNYIMVSVTGTAVSVG